jgi:hypothetical protein
VCAGGSCCTPQTCDLLGRACGVTADGCGAPLDCGPCGSGEVCLGDGSCCRPDTCGTSCGQQKYDGCGGWLDCPACTPH